MLTLASITLVTLITPWVSWWLGDEITCGIRGVLNSLLGRLFGVIAASLVVIRTFLVVVTGFLVVFCSLVINVVPWWLLLILRWLLWFHLVFWWLLLVLVTYHGFPGSYVDSLVAINGFL